MLSIKINERYHLEHYKNTNDCWDLVSKSCNEYWKLRSDSKSKINYSFDNLDDTRTIGCLFKRKMFDGGFTILYINNIPSAFGGIRRLDDTTSIIMARGFCHYTTKPVIAKIMVPFQLRYSMDSGYHRSIITFNDYNKKLYDLWPKMSKMDSIISENFFNINHLDFSMTGIKNINCVDQYVIEWDLK
jgi:hypothetical protein